jgi:hypothetical protein
LQLVFLDQISQKAAGAQKVFLAYKIIQPLGAHALSQGAEALLPFGFFLSSLK